MLPIADADAIAEPAIAPIIMAPITLIKARPPGREPTSVFAKAISRWAIPPLFINCPDSTKNGIARSAKLSSPAAILCDIVVKAGIAGKLTSMVSKEDMAILHATGVPIARRTIKLKTKTITGIYSAIIIYLEGQKFYNK